MEDEFTLIPPHLAVRRWVDGTAPNEASGSFYATFSCMYDPRIGSYSMQKLVLMPGVLDGEPITSAGIRQVRVQEIIRSMVASNVRGIDDDWTPSDGIQKRPKTDLEYRDAAREYVAARLVGDPPLVRVATVYQVSKPTATRIMAEARRRGFSTDG